MKVFVYGTLKTGGLLFLSEHARAIRKAEVEGKIYKHGNVPFPFADFMVEGTVVGEIHEYDPLMLEVLDRIECGAGYKRVRVVTKTGEEAWAYHYPFIDSSFTEIEGGEFNQFERR
jgi:gamma-glutamylcyclotransferase (GGCT)/AIG2-like uncharacterized protein YtfP